MDDRAIGIGFMVIFVACIWVIATLWAIYKVLVAILAELRRVNAPDDLDS